MPGCQEQNKTSELNSRSDTSQTQANPSSFPSACPASSSATSSSQPACSPQTSRYDHTHPILPPPKPSRSHLTSFPSADPRHPRLANNKPIPQCRNQLLQRQQVNSNLPPRTSHQLPPRRLGLLLRCSGPQRAGPALEIPFPGRKNDPRTSRPLRSRGKRRRIECVPHAEL